MATIETAPRIKTNGAPLADKWLERLVSLRIDRPIGVVGRAVLRFRDDGYQLTQAGQVGVGKQLLVSDPSGAKNLFAGWVTGIGVEQTTDAVPELTVTVDDAAHALARSSSTMSYVEMTSQLILQKLASRNGLTLDHTATAVQQEYLLQSGSELDFLEELTRRSHAVWWVSPTKPGALKVATPGASVGASVTLTVGEDLLRFSVKASGMPTAKVEVTGWDRTRTASVTETVTSAPPPGGSSLLSTVAQGAKQLLPATSAVRVADQSPATANEAKVLATSLFHESKSAAVLVKGTTFGNGKIDIGTPVVVKGAGPAAGEYVVTGVEHVYDRRGFYTTFTAGPHRPVGLVDTLGPAAESGTALAGVVVGVVTNNNDTAGLGRVKVKYVGVSDQLESTWARVVTLGGGKNRGMVFVPEVNDEVLIGFERGDTRYPVVLGGLFSTKNALPTGEDAVKSSKVEHRRITSRVGHMLELSDAAGKEHALLRLGGSNSSHRLRIGADRIDLEIAKNKPIKISNGTASIELAANGDIILKGTNIKIESTANTDIKANGTLNAKATGPAAVEGATATVKGKGTAELSASGIVTVKGASVAIN
jgi:uncharacterized protein involved in type VI secretion and phage assembly